MKIDVAKIDGYENMTVEEKISALEGYEFETEDVTKLKTLLNKANGEAAEYKRALREKQTEDEVREAERVEKEKAMQDRLAELERDKAVASYKSSYLALGYSDELAQSSAEAMVSGDTVKIFANQKAFSEAQKTNLMASLVNKQPDLSSGGVPETNKDDQDISDFRKYLGI